MRKENSLLLLYYIKNIWILNMINSCEICALRLRLVPNDHNSMFFFYLVVNIDGLLDLVRLFYWNFKVLNQGRVSLDIFFWGQLSHYLFDLNKFIGNRCFVKKIVFGKVSFQIYNTQFETSEFIFAPILSIIHCTLFPRLFFGVGLLLVGF